MKFLQMVPAVMFYQGFISDHGCGDEACWVQVEGGTKRYIENHQELNDGDWVELACMSVMRPDGWGIRRYVDRCWVLWPVTSK